MKHDFKHFDLYYSSVLQCWNARQFAMRISVVPIIGFLGTFVFMALSDQLNMGRAGQGGTSIIATAVDALINAYIAERWINVLKGGNIFPPLNQYVTENGKLLAMLFFIQSAALLGVFPIISGLVIYINLPDVFPFAIIFFVVPLWLSLYFSATVLKYSLLIPLLAIGDRSQNFADIKKVTHGHKASILGMSVLIYAPVLILVLVDRTSTGLSLDSLISTITVTLLSLACLFVWLSYLTKLAQKLRLMPSWQ